MALIIEESRRGKTKKSSPPILLWARGENDPLNMNHEMDDLGKWENAHQS